MTSGTMVAHHERLRLHHLELATAHPVKQIGENLGQQLRVVHLLVGLPWDSVHGAPQVVLELSAERHRRKHRLDRAVGITPVAWIVQPRVLVAFGRGRPRLGAGRAGSGAVGLVRRLDQARVAAPGHNRRRPRRWPHHVGADPVCSRGRVEGRIEARTGVVVG